MEGAGNTHEPHRGEKVLDWFVIVFCLWTLAAHIAVLTRANLYAVLFNFTFLLIYLYAVHKIVHKIVRKRSIGEEYLVKDYQRLHDTEARPRSRLLRYADLAMAIAFFALVLITYGLTRDLRISWCILVLFFCLSHAITLRWPLADQRAEAIPFAGFFVLMAAAAVTVVTLTMIRPNPDDAFYLNVAVTAFDSPREPVIQEDGIHGIAGAPVVLAVAKVQSYELLIAICAYILHIPPIYIAHILFPVLASILAVYCYAALHKYLFPKSWLWATVVVIALLVIVGEPSHSYGNFSFLRIHQGKCIFLTTVLPLLVAKTIHFLRYPTVRNWLLLAATQVCAVGFSSSALFAAPLCVGLTAAALWRPTMPSLKVSILALSTTLYLVSAGLILRATTVTEVAGMASANFADPMHRALVFLFGKGAFAYLALFCLMFAGKLSESSTGRRLGTGVPLIFLLTVGNPFLYTLVTKYLIAEIVYWRAFWSFPLMSLIVIPLVLPPGLLGSGKWPFVRNCLQAGVVCASIFFLSSTTIFGYRSVRMDPFSLRVPKHEYAVAGHVNRLAGAGSYVLVPTEISAWIPISPGHAHPIVCRPIYTGLMQNYIGGRGEMNQRLRLLQYIAGKAGGVRSRDALREGIQHYDLSVVGFNQDVPWAGEIRNLLAEEAFECAYSDSKYELWSVAMDAVDRQRAPSFEQEPAMKGWPMGAEDL